MAKQQIQYIRKACRSFNGIREMCRLDPITFASIDEMLVVLNSAPSYGYAPRGQRAVILQPSKSTVSRMLTSRISCSGVIYCDLREGAITAKEFSEILRKLPDGLTLMLDNSRHTLPNLAKQGSPTIAELAESKMMSLKYIPSYAPHLNPVEYTFNMMRTLLRRKQAWTERSV